MNFRLDGCFWRVVGNWGYKFKFLPTVKPLPKPAA